MQEHEAMKFYVAAEKIEVIIFSIERMLEYVEEFEIKPDDSVKEILSPVLEKLNTWLK